MSECDSHEHFASEMWVDFVRCLAPADQYVRMRAHLDSGCEECRSACKSWFWLMELASREMAYSAPDEIVRWVKAAFAWRDRLAHPNPGNGSGDAPDRHSATPPNRLL
jgi:hypothetical protein